MKSRITVVFMVMFFLVTAATVYSESNVVSLEEFENTVYERGAVTFNNFTLVENDSWTTPNGWKNLKVTLSAKNRGNDALRLNLQFAGKDKNGEIIWAISASPMMGIISEKSLEEISGSVLVKPGTKDRTAEIVIIYSGEK